MRLLVDANLSPVVTARLKSTGHEAVHVGELDLLTATDEVILDAAADERRVIVTADTDFGALLALGGRSGPSVVLLRSADHLAPDEQASLLIATIAETAGALEAGAIVSVTTGRARVRCLPVEK